MEKVNHCLFNISGKVGDLVFCRTGNGVVVRSCTNTLTKKRVQTDPAFARTRENMAEFGRAARYGRLIRNSFQPLINDRWRRELTGRVVRQIRQAFEADTDHQRGQRDFCAAGLQVLEGFEFSKDHRFRNLFPVPVSVRVGKKRDSVIMTSDYFVASPIFNLPAGADHYQVVLVAASIVFESGSTAVNSASTSFLVPDKKKRRISLKCSVQGLSGAILLVGAGIRFARDVNGTKIPTGTSDAAVIMKATG